jgi:acylphosphatase
VVGWVRNEPDGSVAAHFEGEPDAVEAMVAWCEEGPRRARVERVDVREAEATGARSFDVD